MKPKTTHHSQGIFPRWADYLSQVVVLYSIVTFTLETEPQLTGLEFFYYSEVAVTLFFAGEYLLRIALAEDRWGYIKSFFGVVDFMATAPMILTFGLVDLRFARIIRLLRLLRLLKFIRYSRSSTLLIRAVQSVRGELMVFMFCILGIVYSAAVGIYFFEAEAQPEHFGSITRSMWWSVVTLTTVGYGDVTPITAAGKMFTVIILMLGLGVVAIPSGLIASAMMRLRVDQGPEESDDE